MNPVASIGRLSLDIVGEIGRITNFALEGALAAVTPPFYWRPFLSALARIGFASLPVVGLTAIFTGGALALNIYEGSIFPNADAFIPSILGVSIVRELGPVLAALMVAGRCSSAMAAEIGAMRVTEQIDAMSTLSVSPFRYLVAPRILATTLALPLLVFIADIIGVYRRLSGVGSSPRYLAAYLHQHPCRLYRRGRRGERPFESDGVRFPDRRDGLLLRLSKPRRRFRRWQCDADGRCCGSCFHLRVELHSDIAVCGFLMAMADAKPKIEIRGLQKSFGANEVLRGVDLDIDEGKSLVIIGGSGTGKSVLIKSILGLVRPDRGTSLKSTAKTSPGNFPATNA